MNPLATNHPISHFRDYFDRSALDLSPTFQRNPVWTDSQASYLVDSILNGMPIPELFVRTITDTEGERRMEVVDGQQRLRSIIRFYSNDMVLEGKDVTDKWRGKTWDSLSDVQKGEFWKYKLVVRELEGASDAEVREMFRRLNANQSSLNPQELRHSQYNGEFISVVEDLASDRWWLENRIVTPSQIRRMKDVEFVSELLVGLMSGPLDKKIGLEEFYYDYDEEFPDFDYWEDVFNSTRKFTSRLVSEDFRGWNTKTEYYSLFLAAGRIVVDEEILKKSELNRAISKLASFREMVNIAKRRDNKQEFHEFVHDYVEAVARASTDKSRRLTRIEIIHSLIDGTSPVD